MKNMTKTQLLQREELMKSARKEFAKLWEDEMKIKTVSVSNAVRVYAELIAWRIFLAAKGLTK